MPTAFTCPHCGVRTDVADEYAGQTGPCVGCGRMVTIAPLTGTPGYSASASSGGGVAVLVIVLVVVVGILAVLSCGGFWLLGRSSGARNAGVAVATADSRAGCQANLQRIGLAMQSYHNAHGCFPPAYLADKDGKPMHSWRVLLLPYLGQQQLHDQYRFTEPWDSPHNARLDAERALYWCPDDLGSPPQQTSYVMIVGPGTISDGPSATRLNDIGRGASNSLMIVEVSASGIQWTEPRDLKADEITFRVNDGSEPGVRSSHAGGVNVLLCDGSVRFLSDSTDPEAIRAMTKVDGP